jgi:hypothetical protein
MEGSQAFFDNKAKSVANPIKSAARFVFGIKGLEYMDNTQQMIILFLKLQQRMQALLDFYHALYKLAMTQEEIQTMTYMATIDAINKESEGRQEFYQMLIDNQLADIQTLMGYVTASFERASEAIREYGETSRMIAQNIKA